MLSLPLEADPDEPLREQAFSETTAIVGRPTGLCDFIVEAEQTHSPEAQQASDGWPSPFGLMACATLGAYHAQQQ